MKTWRNRYLPAATAALLGLCSCMSQPPAPYVDKSNMVFSKHGEKAHSHDKAPQTAFDSPSEHSNEISESTLEPLVDNEPSRAAKPMKAEVPEPGQATHTHKKAEELESTVEPSKHDTGKLTDIDLESQIDKASEPSQTPTSMSTATGSAYRLKSPIGSDKFDWPVEGKVLGHYGKVGNKFNEGMNIAAPLGSPVIASADGKVVYIGNNVEGYGNLLIIKHDGDIMTAYAHLKDIVVDRGATVKRGESIGSVGQVGNVNQPQLHFSMRKGKKTIDPELPL